MNSLLVAPVAPEKGVEIKFTEAADRRSHLVLEPLAAHLADGDNFQADAFLQRNGVIDRAIFNLFELSSSNGYGGELLLGVKQLRGP